MTEEEQGPEEELEQTVDELEHDRDKLDQQVEDVKDDWETKKSSEGVPGAQPEDQVGW